MIAVTHEAQMFRRKCSKGPPPECTATSALVEGAMHRSAALRFLKQPFPQPTFLAACRQP